jgi:hypothetical protein
MLIQKSTRKGKRFMAIFKNGKTVHFGSAVGKTYIDEGNKIKRQNYLARHRVNEDWTKINPASLSRFILWGDYTSIDGNIAAYKRMFNV